MKLCVNCVHFLRPPYEGPKCYHPSNVEVEPIYGMTLTRFAILTRRGLHGDCGPDGTQYEEEPPKPPNRLACLFRRA